MTSEATKKLTEYAVLKEVGDGQYRLISLTDAANDTKAIEVSTVEHGAGAYYAIPTRSFKRRELIVENVPVRRIA